MLGDARQTYIILSRSTIDISCYVKNLGFRASTISTIVVQLYQEIAWRGSCMGACQNVVCDKKMHNCHASMLYSCCGEFEPSTVAAKDSHEVTNERGVLLRGSSLYK